MQSLPLDQGGHARMSLELLRILSCAPNYFNRSENSKPWRCSLGLQLGYHLKNSDVAIDTPTESDRVAVDG